MKKLFFLFLFIGPFSFLFSQEMAVVFIEGNVKTGLVSQSESHYKALQYGPIQKGHQLLLAKRAKVKLLRSNGDHCELDQPGLFLVDNLTFSPAEEQSIFKTFGNYFLSFFEAHASSESKENYKNTAFAISRGELSPPIPEFPFSGIYPAEHKEINFFWNSNCDTCEYTFQIIEKGTNRMVYSCVTPQKTVKIKNWKRNLKVGVPYYWNVKNAGADEETTSHNLVIDGEVENSKEIKQIESLLNDVNLGKAYIPRTIYVMSQLQNDGKLNSAYLYGKNMVTKHKKDIYFKELVDRFYYDELKNRLD